MRAVWLLWLRRVTSSVTPYNFLLRASHASAAQRLGQHQGITPLTKEKPMFIRSFLVATAVAMSSVVPAAALDHAPNSAPCVLNAQSITRVEPYRVHKPAGRGTVEQLRGAAVYVRAERGLTAEWLQANLAQHIKQMEGMTMQDCAFDVRDVSVAVDSAGSGFVVKIAAKDPGQAKEVLRRAKLLVH